MTERVDASASDESLKLAIAISLLRSKILKNVKESSALSPSQSESLLRWKRKVRNPSFLPNLSDACFFPSDLRYFVFGFSG